MEVIRIKATLGWNVFTSVFPSQKNWQRFPCTERVFKFFQRFDNSKLGFKKFLKGGWNMQCYPREPYSESVSRMTCYCFTSNLAASNIWLNIYIYIYIPIVFECLPFNLDGGWPWSVCAANVLRSASETAVHQASNNLPTWVISLKVLSGEN